MKHSSAVKYLCLNFREIIANLTVVLKFKNITIICIHVTDILFLSCKSEKGHVIMLPFINMP